MELLVLFGLVALGWIALGHLARRGERDAVQQRLNDLNEQQRRQVERDRLLRQQQARQQQARLNQLYGQMQAGLLQVNQAPDFQRAASLAGQARDVPVIFRQQQFRRFRGTLIEHFARRLTAGTDEEILRASLTTLVQAMGMADFEAQYIETEARQRLSRTGRREPVSYADRLQRLQADHEQRMATLRTLEGLDADTREHLLEAEQNRHREALLIAGNEQPRPPTNR